MIIKPKCGMFKGMFRGMGLAHADKVVAACAPPTSFSNWDAASDVQDAAPSLVWDGKTDTATNLLLETTITRKSSAKSLKIRGADKTNAYLSESISIAEGWLYWGFRLSAITGDMGSGDYNKFIFTEAGPTDIFRFEVRELSAETLNGFRLTWFDEAQTTFTADTSATLAANTWYLVKIYYKKATNAGSNNGSLLAYYKQEGAGSWTALDGGGDGTLDMPTTVSLVKFGRVACSWFSTCPDIYIDSFEYRSGNDDCYYQE